MIDLNNRIILIINNNRYYLQIIIYMSTSIRDISSYNSITRAQSGCAVIKCGAEWCSPCKRIAHAYEDLARKYPQIKFYTLDIDEVKYFADAKEVNNLPTFLFFASGSLVGKVIGADLRSVEIYVANMR